MKAARDKKLFNALASRITIPELIAELLHAIRHQFYADRIRDFKRDERALTKAISRYGYECVQRGWHFQADQILRGLLDLLNEIKRSDADIQYLPVYLHGAVGRHIGQRAEELSAQAKTIKPRAVKIIQGALQVQAVVEPSDAEILGAVYRDIRRHQRQRRHQVKPIRQLALC